MQHPTTPEEFLKNKKVLVVVLGAYGGGVATAKWLFRHGAKVTVTDMRTRKELASQIKKFTQNERKNIKLVLGGQHEKDFIESDMIVIGPGVPDESPYLEAARKAGVSIENEASLFFRFVKRPVIAITGTRGKTTTAFWISSLLSKKYPDVKVCGNAQTSLTSGSNPLLAEIERVKDTKTPIVAELSSWTLEYAPIAKRSAHIAIITNLFPDHLDRYGSSMEKYALAKANIFAHQTKDDFLILNKKNKWSKFFLKQKPKSKVLFSQDFAIPQNLKKTFGEHNYENLQVAVAAVTLFDTKLKINAKMFENLPSIPFRQEIIFEKKRLVIVNDSAATSPDATSALLKRFSWRGYGNIFSPRISPQSRQGGIGRAPTHARQKNIPIPSPTVLITGGTDKELDFKNLAKDIKKFLSPEQVIFLNGSATKKLLIELEKIKFFAKNSQQKKQLQPKVFEDLRECFAVAFHSLPKKQGTILFSPGAASFEKFKNEFDRGERFNKLMKDFERRRVL
ncbi:hypothetical protein L0Y69_02730 [bacterium]|nr:hypothetical protein [bacterium]